MSGLCAVWRRDGAPVGPAWLPLLAAMGHRAVDGQDHWMVAGGDVVLAHQHFWTTPEELGERQPHVAAGVAVAFDGRLDNRTELAAALDLTSAEAARLSDAALVWRAYRRWASDCVAHLKGPFALLVYDERRRGLLCARDRLGLRPLFYHLAADALVVASEPGAVVAWPGVDASLDGTYLAHYFALWPPPEEVSLYAGVRALPAAHQLWVTADDFRLERYWTLALNPVYYGATDEYADHFRELLDRAVQRRLRAPGPPAVLMSGGLDSPAVTALAAGHLASTGHAERLRVFSYVFDDLAELDERPWMAPMVARYGLDQTQVCGDEAWPLCDVDRWRWNPSGPDTGPFRPLNDLLFAAARQAGVRVLLTGASSDGLFSAAASWLSDLVADGRYREAAEEMRKYVRHVGCRRVLRSASVRRLAADLMGHEARPTPPPPWLTPHAVGLLRHRAVPVLGVARGRPADVQAALASICEDDGAAGGYGSEAIGIDLRDPYSDLDLVQFTLALPAYLLYNRGSMKLVLRRAMRAQLPDEVLGRVQRSDISPLYRRGVGDRARLTVARWLDDPGATWSRYVRPSWLAECVAGSGQTGPAYLVVWQCVALQWWLRNDPRPDLLRPKGPLADSPAPATAARQVVGDAR